MAVENIHIESQGIALGAHLHVPDSGIAEAGVICVTGGGSPAAELYHEWQAYFAAEGIASLSFDARGIGCSDGRWSTGDGPPEAGRRYNSQYSRMVDTLSVTKYLRQLGLAKRAILLGSSMGGDIAIAAANELGQEGRPADGLVLKGPAAYHPHAFYQLYGRALAAVLGDNELYPRTASNNFKTLEDMGIPSLLIFAAGDEVIPEDLQEQYRGAVWNLPGSQLVAVGDETTSHKYFAQSDKASLRAKEVTFERSAEFILQRCTA